MDVIRRIPAELVRETVCRLFIDANHRLGDDVKNALKRAKCQECTSIARSVLESLCENLTQAARIDVPVCQDTGMAVVFIELGALAHIEGDTLENAVNAGVHDAYINGKLRLSIVKDPLYQRENTGDNTPAILHIRSVPGDCLKITVAPKGFGSENMSCIRMLTPSATEDDVVNFVVDTVRRAGSNPCPPITVGIGIGSDFEGSAILAKKALTRSLGEPSPDARYEALEKRILAEINMLDIGPQGFGGATTAMAVHIETAPTHIAGLPVAVNINCHVVRHMSAVL
jgi:fumarate hydratase subunit alpha